MGLDGVELVMAIEDEFNLEISEADGAHLISVGDTYNYVIESLQSRGETPDKEAIWLRLRGVIVEQLGVRPRQVVMTAEFVRDLGVG